MNAEEMTADVSDVAGVVLDQVDRLFQELCTSRLMRDADSLANDGVVSCPAGAWETVSEAGLPLALAPEDAGGAGLSPDVAFAVMRRAAYYTLPVPLAETMIGAALWSAVSGEVPDGILTLCPYEVRADRGRVSGTLARVPWGAEADHVLALTLENSSGAMHIARIVAPRGVWRRGASLAGEPRDTAVVEALRAETYPATIDLRAAGAAVRATQMVGAMERAFEHAITHANERHQFGRPVAKFQAVQHMLAEAAGHLAAASATADCVGEAWGTRDLRLAAAIAKSRTGEAAGKVAAVTHQVLAAMGFTQEHPLHYASRRLWSWRDKFGGEAEWEAEIGRAACATGGDTLWEMVLAASHPGTNG